MALSTGPKHHSAPPGRRVRVELRNGKRYDTRFVEKNRRYCIVEAGRFPWSRVAKFYILKGDH